MADLEWLRPLTEKGRKNMETRMVFQMATTVKAWMGQGAWGCDGEGLVPALLPPPPQAPIPTHSFPQAGPSLGRGRPAVLGRQKIGEKEELS